MTNLMPLSELTNWTTLLAAAGGIVGGGFGTKLLDLVRGKQQTDGSNLENLWRAVNEQGTELRKEIGALNERIGELESEVKRVRKSRHLLIGMVNRYMMEMYIAQREANDMGVKLGLAPQYDLSVSARKVLYDEVHEAVQIPGEAPSAAVETSDGMRPPEVRARVL